MNFPFYPIYSCKMECCKKTFRLSFNFLKIKINQLNFQINKNSWMYAVLLNRPLL
jgi:hypothetical protein